MNRFSIFAILLLMAGGLYAQEEIQPNPLRYGVPSLTIAPDARGGAMGDIGAATDPDIFSQYWNPAKYAFAYSKAGISFSFTPWLAKLVDDINVSYLVGYYKLNDDMAISSSLRYFSLGDVLLKNTLEDVGLTINPYEASFDAGISLKLSEKYSMAVTFRGIYSDLGAGRSDDAITPAAAIAADIAGYYNTYFMAGRNECLLGLGFNISNIGNKVSYDGGTTSMFLPANLRLGASVVFPLDDYNSLSINADVNKYLVPTPPVKLSGDTGWDATWSDNISPVAGIFRSFHDAPGGLKEELQEITYSVGAEYAYDYKFFVRGGYFHESQYKGNRQYFSLGTGFKLTAFQLDVSYLISTVPSNPLDQTLRFSLSFDFDGLKNLMR
ncbi:MAG: type IX secretion system outer membrane channel protein PorV [Dysgonamonadaceae bacterium]|jgi:hypothetical protein|nr:type IX secretion system outer membrane channel protein PorV [Dysgonamonadaceae bacterium]